MRRIHRDIANRGQDGRQLRVAELSQHFLRSDSVAGDLVLRLRLPTGAWVIEAGAGDGVLTEALARAGYRVTAIEKDARLFAALETRMAPYTRVRCVRGDFLRYPLPAQPYVAVSNVPYAITAALLRKLLHAARPPDTAYLIVQREAAQKFAGLPRETLFSLLHKPRFEFHVERGPRRGDFIPPPRVESALLRIDRRPAPLIAPSSAPLYRAVLRDAFGADTVARGLRGYVTPRQVRRLGSELGFAGAARPSYLAFDQWLAIFRFVEHECLGHDPTVVDSGQWTGEVLVARAPAAASAGASAAA